VRRKGSVASISESEVRLVFRHNYPDRAVDSHGDTLDFMLSERRDEDAATAFFKQASN
jgi:putative transposase